MPNNEKDFNDKDIYNVVPTLKQQHYRDNKAEQSVQKKEQAKKEKEEKRERERVRKEEVKAGKRRPVGRPRKQEIEQKKKPGKIGRPKGDAAIINEYKARMLASPKSEKVLEAIFDAALNDEHKAQAAAWKILMDRMLPISAFDKDVNGGNSRPTVQINFGTIGNNEPEIRTIDGNTIDNDEE